MQFLHSDDIWREFPQLACGAVDGSAAKSSARAIVTKAFLLNTLDPKLTLFFLALRRGFRRRVRRPRDEARAG